jgi:nucleoside-diphosphate-sugar epimerase
MLIPAQRGTREMLESAHREKGVKRIVVTSSFAAVMNPAALPAIGVTYSGDDWNPVTYEQAAKSDSAPYVYCASKKLAEEEAWNFVKTHNPSFILTTICPPMITGPPLQVIESISSLNASSEVVWGLVDVAAIPPTGFPVFVDVRDVAELHVLAVTKDVAKNQRYLTVANHFDNSQIADILRRHFPEQAHRIPVGPVVAGPEHFKTDSSKVQKELGIKWIDFETSVVDTAREIFRVEAELKK